MARMGQRIDLSSVNKSDAAQELGVEFDDDEYVIASNFRMVPAELWDELVEAFSVDNKDWTKEASERLTKARANRAAIIIKEWRLRDPFTGEEMGQPHGNVSMFMAMAPPLLGLIEQAISLHYASKEAKSEAVGEG